MRSIWVFAGAFILIVKNELDGKELYRIKKSKPFDIDSFLTSVLHSEKFNDLAEKIALRTADKFTKISVQELGSKRNRANDNDLKNKTNPKNVVYSVKMTKDLISPYLSMKYARIKKENQGTSQLGEQIHEAKSQDRSKTSKYFEGQENKIGRKKQDDVIASVEQLDEAEHGKQNKESKSDASIGSHDEEIRGLKIDILSDQELNKDYYVAQNTVERSDISSLVEETTDNTYHKKYQQLKEYKRKHKTHVARAQNTTVEDENLEMVNSNGSQPVESEEIENNNELYQQNNLAKKSVMKSDIGDSENQKTVVTTTHKAQAVHNSTKEDKIKTSNAATAKAEISSDEDSRSDKAESQETQKVNYSSKEENTKIGKATKADIPSEEDSETRDDNAEKNIFEVTKTPKLIRREGENLYIHEDERSDYAEYHEKLRASLKI